MVMILEHILWEVQNLEHLIGQHQKHKMIIQILVVNFNNNFLVFKATLSCVGVSIVSGGAAERLTFLAWGVLALFYSGFVSPAIVHWTNSNGWLTKLGYKDLAGAGFIFYSAGVAALVVTVVSKPRKYRFDPNSTLNF